MRCNANTNTARVWSLGKPIKRTATYVKTKVIGFYSLNGKSLIDFLKKIRSANSKKRIVIVLDNFRTPHAKKVKEEAEKMNIRLVYLPLYSPDLNPIENIWKSVKRIVSEISPLNL